MARKIRIDNSLPGLAALLARLPENAVNNFERMYVRKAMAPYRNDFIRQLQTLYPKRGVRSYSKGKVVETTGRVMKSITMPKTVKVKDMGQSKSQLRVLGFFYAKKQEDLPKSKKNPAKRPNVGTVLGWLNFGTLTHSTGKGDITSKNIISRINYFERRRTDLIAKRDILQQHPTKSNLDKIARIDTRLTKINKRYSELVSRRGGRGPGQGHDTGKLVKGITANHVVTKASEKMHRNLNQSMIEFIRRDVANYISGINKGNYISGLAQRY